MHEQIHTYLNFQINHYLYNEFNDKVVSDDDWKELIPDDTTLDDGIQELEKKVNAIKGSLADVQKMQTQY